MRKWLARENGFLTVFFAGFLSLLLVVVGILGDYLRIQVAGAEMLTGLRLSSRMGLAQFDKKLAREYGLFVVKNPEEVDMLAKKGWERRYAPSAIRSDSFILHAPEIQVEKVEGMILSEPKVIEDQIDQFMDWQTPRLLWSEVEAHFDIYNKISQLGPVMDAKATYEKGLKNYHDQLVHIGKLLSNTSALPEAWTIVHGGCQILKGIPSLQENLSSLETGFRNLETSLDKLVNREEDGEDENEDFSINNDDLSRLKDQFDKLKKSYQEMKTGLIALQAYLYQVQQSIKKMSSCSADIQNKAGTWEAAVKNLPSGAMASGFQADYLAKTGQDDFEGFDRLAQEMEEMENRVSDHLEAWKEVSFEGKSLDQLSFSTWLDREKILIEGGRQGKVRAPGKNTLEGKAFSEQALDAQSSLVSIDPDKRSGLLEFIKAWNEKRKLKNRAKWADKLNMVNLAQSLSQYIPADSLKRYQSGGSIGTSSEVSPLGGLSNDQGIIKNVLSGFNQSGRLFTFKHDIGDKESRARLYLYWSRMFSHRTSKKKEKREGKDTLSLTGLPLKERPFYGGELEYILFGKDVLMDNLRRAAISIAGLRLMMNAAYAFTSADLYQETAPLATAIAGWSGFGLPFIQSIFLGILSIGETKLDMDDLLSGMEVPVMKNSTNWRFSLSGIKPLAQSMVGDLFDAGEFQATASIEAANELVNEKMKEIASSSKEMAKNAIKTPIQTWMTQALSQIQKPDPAKDKARLKALIGQIGGLNSDGALDGAVREAGLSLEGRIGDLLSGLDMLRKEKEKEKKLTSDLMKKLNDLLDQVIDPVVDQATKDVDGLSAKWTKKLQGIRQTGEEKTKEALGKWLDGFQKELGGGDLGTGLATGAGLSMGYEDYIKLFLFLALVGSGKDSLLVNTCKLIHAENGESDLTLAPTALSWTAGGQVGLSLIGKNRIWAPSLGLQQGVYKIKRSWIEGYGEKEIKPRGGGG